jgi:membrane associated rhomboid family serine protease
MVPMDPSVPPPPPAAAEPTGPVACKRHPNTQTMLRCVRCGDPICPECMRPAAVGYQCPDDAKGSRQEYLRPARNIGASAAGATVTKALLLVLVIVYAIEVAQAGPGSLLAGPTIPVLIRLGAIVPALIADGEYWRLFTGMFLHASLLHIALNGYALYIVGSVVESELGRWRFLALYLVTGLFGSAAVYMFSGIFEPTIGASGAIFGLFGVFAAYNFRRRDNAFYAARLRSMLTVIVINLLFTFFVPGISKAGHIGGLVCGLLLGLAIDGIGRRTSRAIAFWSAIAVAIALTVAIVVIRTPQIPPNAGEHLRAALRELSA